MMMTLLRAPHTSATPLVLVQESGRSLRAQAISKIFMRETGSWISVLRWMLPQLKAICPFLSLGFQVHIWHLLLGPNIIFAIDPETKFNLE